jgi:glyoxylase-like metal-dependent hydrolase (beta-lactamase superfamily II)
MEKIDIDPPEKGTMRQVAEDVFWMRFDLPFRLNHINLYALDAADSWILIDCGINSPETATHWDSLLNGPLAGKPVSKIIVSHYHVDHIGYAGTLAARTGGEIWMSKDEDDQVKTLDSLKPGEFANELEAAYRRYGLDENSIADAREDDARYAKYVTPLPEVRILNPGDVIASAKGNWNVRVDRGHSPGQIGLTDTLRGIYISIDFLLPRISPNISADFRHPEIDKLGQYLTYLDSVADLPDEMLILPGHDWPFRQGGRRARALIEHHHQRLDNLREAAASTPISTAMAMQILFGRVFNPHEQFFASGEANAHLAHLVHLGEFQTHNENGIEFFLPA